MIIVVCEDTEAAVSYFTLLKKIVEARVTLDVHGAPRKGATPDRIVEFAQELLADLESGREEPERDSAWALIDLEGDSERQRAAEQAKAAGEQVGVRVLLSKPCYELWTLLHLVDTGEMFADCRAVLRVLEAAWQDEFKQQLGKKAQADYDKIIDNRMKAAQRARKHHTAGDPSWTVVYLLIEEIERLCASA